LEIEVGSDVRSLFKIALAGQELAQAKHVSQKLRMPKSNRLVGLQRQNR